MDEHWEEFQDDLSDAANIAGYGQRAETNKYLAEQNRLLRAEQDERRRIQSLPKCPRCKLPLDHEPSVCRGCGAALRWDEYFYPNVECILRKNWCQYLNREYDKAHKIMVSQLYSHVAPIKATVDLMARTQHAVEDRISSVAINTIEPLLDEPISELHPNVLEKLSYGGKVLSKDSWQERDVFGSPFWLFLKGFWWSTFGEPIFYLCGFLGVGSAYWLWSQSLYFWFVCLLSIVCVVVHGLFIKLIVDGFRPFVNSLRKTGVHAKTNACRKARLIELIKDSSAIQGELTLRTSVKELEAAKRIRWLRLHEHECEFPSQSAIESFVGRIQPLPLGDCKLRRLPRTLYENRLLLMRFERELLSLLLKDENVISRNYKSRVMQLDQELKRSESTANEAENKTDRDYWIKRGETIRGPLERVAILQAATGKKLMSGDQIANSKDGPWQDITKEQLQQMQQGNDVEIK